MVDVLRALRVLRRIVLVAAEHDDLAGAGERRVDRERMGFEGLTVIVFDYEPPAAASAGDDVWP